MEVNRLNPRQFFFAAGRQEFITEIEKTYGDMPASFRFSDFRANEVSIEGDNATVSWKVVEPWTSQ